jgi:hypothetical protein
MLQQPPWRLAFGLSLEFCSKTYNSEKTPFAKNPFCDLVKGGGVWETVGIKGAGAGSSLRSSSVTPKLSSVASDHSFDDAGLPVVTEISHYMVQSDEILGYQNLTNKNEIYRPGT